MAIRTLHTCSFHLDRQLARQAEWLAKQKLLSGRKWVALNDHKFPNSVNLEDLHDSFRDKVKGFLAALDEAGIQYSINSTKRNIHRAWVMHHAWRVAKAMLAPEQVPIHPKIPIIWDHDDQQISVRAAKEMIGAGGFNMRYIASLTSHHVLGKAIDMSIYWTGEPTIRKKTGELITITSDPKTGMNPDLWAVGASYQVIKKQNDVPHWSIDGK